MAIGAALPPQAYTRDVLSQAYTWIQGQADSVKKLATTPDMLVSLYLRHQRYGDVVGLQDVPVSSQNFKSDLKHLAEDLKQFEEEKVRLAPAPHLSPAPMYQEPPPAPVRVTLEDVLDGKSLKMIQEVKNALNLSTEIDACRALLSLGFERMKTIFR